MRAPLLLLLVAVLLGGGAVLAAAQARESDRAGSGERPSPQAVAEALVRASATATPVPLAPAGKAPQIAPVPRLAARPAIPARPSRALGLPYEDGRLVRGVELPVEGPDHLTWNGVERVVPNPAWRRYGTDSLVRTVLAVLAEHRRANPGAPRVLVGDLSRPEGGVFDARYGGLGHNSHQNGLDVDVYYPRKDRLPIEAARPEQVDRRLAQDLVDRFVAHGAELVVVGREVGLTGPADRVIELDHHEDHLHVRMPDSGR